MYWQPLKYLISKLRQSQLANSTGDLVRDYYFVSTILNSIGFYLTRDYLSSIMCLRLRFARLIQNQDLLNNYNGLALELTMMTSSNGNIFRVTVFCAGNSPVTDEFPSQRPVTRSFIVFFDLRLNKQLNKQSWGQWIEMPSRSSWRHCNTWGQGNVAAYHARPIKVLK